MPTTPILGITQVTASQNNKEVTINNAIEALENATNANFNVDFTSGTTQTLSNSQTTGSFLFNAINATAACILQFPTTINSIAVNRIVAVRNTSGHGLTVRFTGTPGTTVSIPNGETRLLALVDGTDVTVAAEPATTVTFLSLTDTPSTFAGQTGKFLSVNVGETALEFVPAATFPSFTGNAGEYLIVNGTEDGVEWAPLSISTAFTDLTDSPATYTGQAGRYVVVNGTENGVEFIDLPDLEAVEFVAAQRWRINVQVTGVDPQCGFGEVQWLDQDGLNLVGSGTASASNEATGNEAEIAFDGDTAPGNGWLTEATYAGPIWLEYNFGSPVIPRTLRAFPVGNFPDFSPLEFIIEYWNGVTWVSAGTRIPAPWDPVASQDFKVNGQPLTSIPEAPNNGTAFVRQSAAWVQPSIDMLSDVDTVTNPPADGQALVFDTALNSWVPGSVGSSGGVSGPAAQAFVQFSNGASPTIDAQTNVSSVTRTATGRYRITFATPFPDANYSMAAIGRYNDGALDLPNIGVDRTASFGKETTHVDILAMTNGGVASDNIDFINIAFFDHTTQFGLGATITETGTSADLLQANARRYQRWTATGAKTLTVRPNSTEAITQDSEFYIANRAASGNLTLVQGTGVSINVPAGGGLVLEPGMVATLKRVAVDEYDLVGQSKP